MSSPPPINHAHHPTPPSGDHGGSVRRKTKLREHSSLQRCGRQTRPPQGLRLRRVRLQRSCPPSTLLALHSFTRPLPTAPPFHPPPAACFPLSEIFLPGGEEGSSSRCRAAASPIHLPRRTCQPLVRAMCHATQELEQAEAAIDGEPDKLFGKM